LIRITKPATVPAKLKVEGKKQRSAHSQAFTKNPTAYQTGTQKLQPLKKLHRLIQLAADRPDDLKLQQFAQEAQDTLEMAVQDNAEFAAAIRAAIKDQFQYVDD
jgi:hypothetical protein